MHPHADTKAPLTRDGQEISAIAGRHTIWIIRVAVDHYRVVTLDEHKRRAPGWCTDFTPERIAADSTVEDAARRFARAAFRTFHGAFEIHAPGVRKAA